MDYIHVKNLEKYHPGYKDRTLYWAKIHCTMVHGDPECEMIDNETDWARLIKFILLEITAKKPIPLDEAYLTKKGFDLKKRPISLTLKMLHNFLDTVTEDQKLCSLEKSRVEESREGSVTNGPIPIPPQPSAKQKHLTFVYLLPEEYAKLTGRFGEEEVAKYIFRLNNYIGSTGKKYKSHYHTILNWSDMDVRKSTGNQI